MSRSLARGWLLTLWAGCSDYGVSVQEDKDPGPAPDIVVEPASLTYGMLSTGEEEVQTFTVRNVGGSTLHVSDVVIGSGLAFDVRGPETTFDLEPDEETTVDVAFSPMGANENFGQALVMSDDPDTPEAGVDLLGLGAVPELQITPDSYIFGDTFIPCGTTVELELKNIGSESLVITDFEYRSGGMLTLDDLGLEEDLPVTLAPDETRMVAVTFLAATIGADTGVLEVTSNDPRGVVSADQNGEGSFSAENTESFEAPGIAPVDVMMLIDQSSSMDDDEDDIEIGMPDFIAEIQTVADWQLIEVTKQDACANGGIITPATANPDQLLINNAFNAPLNLWGEALLRQANEALQKTDPGECNEGFLRPGALLHIIIISDEPDASLNTSTWYINEYATHVAAPEYVKISGVIDVNTTCGAGPAGYLSAVNATGGSLIDICGGSWGASFSDIASDILAGIRTYNLSDPAIPETLVVTVNGTVTTDVTYADAGNSVTVNSPPVGEGDVVEITYSVASSDCEN